MLATTPTGGPATFVAINGTTLSATAAPNNQQFNPANPAAMFATMPSNMTAPPGLLTHPNNSPFLFPSIAAFPPVSSSLASSTPFSSGQFHGPSIPFFAPAGGMLTTNGPGPAHPHHMSLPMSFSAPHAMPQHMLQSPAAGHPLNAAFSSNFSLSSVFNQSLASHLAAVAAANSNAASGQGGSLLPDHNQLTTMNPAILPPHSMLLPVPMGTNYHNSHAGNNSSVNLTMDHSIAFALATCGANAIGSNVVSNCTTSLHGNTLSGLTTTATNLSLAVSKSNMITPCSRPVGAPISTANTMVSTPTTSVSPTPSTEPICVTPTLQTSFKIDKLSPVPITTTSISTNYSTATTTNATTSREGGGSRPLESVDFHRDEILDAIDKLRERKARPDFERISCMLKRHRNIQPDQTQICLRRLAAAGAVVCVDYKGNMSYRNPSKWRKTAVHTGISANPLGISQRLLDAMRRLQAGTVYEQQQVPKPQIANATGPFLLQVPAGPLGGFSLLQIERAIQVLDSSSGTDTSNQKPYPELRGATLRVCLDREATHGKLAKLSDGRYVLDESGERKRLSASTMSTQLSLKKPLPPHGSLSSSYQPTNASKLSGKSYGNVTCPIAPARESTNRPLAAKQLPSGNGITISRLGHRVISPIPLRGTRRGRPPGSKTMKSSIPVDIVPFEKKIKTELHNTLSTANGLSNTITTSTSNNPTELNDYHMSPFTTAITSVTPHASITTASVLPKSNMIGGFTHAPNLPLNGLGVQQATSIAHPLPTSFIANMAHVSNNLMSTAAEQTVPPFPLSDRSINSCSTTFTPTPFFAFPQTGGPTMSVGYGESCTMIAAPTSESVRDSTSILKLDNEADTITMCKSEAGLVEGNEASDLCTRCGYEATKEEAFLVCKDCNLRAHPTCLDYWPELTDRARQAPWQCTDCKTCTVCQGNQFTTELLVCDACDKGFHAECHQPKLPDQVDRSLPWVCGECQHEGYSVAIGTLPPDNVPGSYADTVTDDSSDQAETISPTVNKLLRKDDVQPSDKDSSDIKVDAVVPNPSTPTKNPTSSPSPARLSGSSTPVPMVTSPPTSMVTSSLPNSETAPLFNKGNEDALLESEPDPTAASARVYQSPHSREGTSDWTKSWDSCQKSTILDNRDPREDADSHPLSSTETTDHPMIDGTASPCHRPTDIRGWSVDHVHDWLLDEGFPREAEAFSQQEIDGACLLLMKRMDVLTELGIKLGPAVKIYERIKRLQSTCSSPTVLNA